MMPFLGINPSLICFSEMSLIDFLWEKFEFFFSHCFVFSLSRETVFNLTQRREYLILQEEELVSYCLVIAKSRVFKGAH